MFFKTNFLTEHNQFDRPRIKLHVSWRKKISFFALFPRDKKRGNLGALYAFLNFGGALTGDAAVYSWFLQNGEKQTEIIGDRCI